MPTTYKILRVQSDLTQAEVERLTKIKQPTLSRIERGISRPTTEQVKRLGQVYGIEDAQIIQTQK